MTCTPAGELAPSSISCLFEVAVVTTVKRERERETEGREARTNSAQDIFRGVVSWHVHSALSPRSSYGGEAWGQGGQGG